MKELSEREDIVIRKADKRLDALKAKFSVF